MPDTPQPRLQVVVVNNEEQYSIWPAGRELPPGWRPDGFTGTEDEWLAYIDETWTDMRRLSLRRWMQDHGRQDHEMRDPGMGDHGHPGAG